MSYRDVPETATEYIRFLEDRIRALEGSTQINARSWTITENSTGDLVFSHIDGRIVTISKSGSNTTI